MFELIINPFFYLKIRHQFKAKADWALPLVLTALTLIGLWVVGWTRPVAFWSEPGVISRVLGFTQGLPGFYIAALAAIATFNKLDIDKKMPAPAPRLKIHVRGVGQEIELTRRRFLCLMFAFLTAESILLIVIAICALGSAAGLKASLPSFLIEPMYWIGAAIFLFVFWQMVVVTLWGIYYLGDRLHQVDTE